MSPSMMSCKSWPTPPPEALIPSSSDTSATKYGVGFTYDPFVNDDELR